LCAARFSESANQGTNCVQSENIRVGVREIFHNQITNYIITSPIVARVSFDCVGELLTNGCAGVLEYFAGASANIFALMEISLYNESRI
jgi:hypothetical protein